MLYNGFLVWLEWDKLHWKQVANIDDIIMQLQTYFYHTESATESD